jgi:hypothetical protein
VSTTEDEFDIFYTYMLNQPLKVSEKIKNNVEKNDTRSKSFIFFGYTIHFALFWFQCRIVSVYLDWRTNHSAGCYDQACTIAFEPKMLFVLMKKKSKSIETANATRNTAKWNRNKALVK